MSFKSKQGNKVLSYRGFRDLWAGQLVSMFGDVLHFLVFLWWANEIGGPVGVGIVMSFSIGTHVLLSMPAGTLVDRFDRRKLLLLSDIVCACVAALMVVAVLALGAKPALWVLCVFAVVLKCAYVVQRPARAAAIPRLVPEDRLLEANSLNTATQMTMPLAGNALGAIVLGVIFGTQSGAKDPTLAYVFMFALNSLTFIVSAMFMAKLPAIEPERTLKASSPWQDAKSGVLFLARHPVLKVMAAVFFLFEFCVAPFMPAYVVAAKTTLGGGLSLFGTTLHGPALLAMLETGFFLGFVLGSWALYRWPRTDVGKSFAVMVFASAMMIVPMGYVTSVWLFWALNFLCGLLMPFGVIPLETYMQKEAPDEYRGRVNAAVGTIAASAAPIGIYVSGFALAGLGLGLTMAGIGIGLGISALSSLLSPHFRAARLSEGEPMSAEPMPLVLEAESA